jgi:hypothetical protein
MKRIIIFFKLLLKKFQDSTVTGAAISQIRTSVMLVLLVAEVSNIKL